MALTPWEEAQRAVIGSLLIDPENVAGLVFSSAKREHFGAAPWRHLYEAALTLWQERRPVDAVTVLAAAGQDYADLIRDAVIATPTANNVEAYLGVIRDEARLHTLQTAAMRIVGTNDVKAAAEIWAAMGRELMQAEQMRRRSFADCVNDYLDRMNDATPPDNIAFGLDKLDRQLAVSQGKFVVLAADSSVGKTALALQFAHNIARSGKRVGFFSLETDSDTLTDRLMAEAAVAGIALPRSKAKALTRKDYSRALDAGQAGSGMHFDLIDRVSTLEEIRSGTVAWGYDVIFVDYLQIIDAPGDKRWDIVTGISIYLHRMAQRLGVTVVALSQITPPEKGSTRQPTMDDLRESRQIKHDADVILILTPDDSFPNARRLTIAKNKDGQRNLRLLLDFDPQHMTFTYHRRVQPSNAEQVEMRELDDEEGGEIPF